MFDIMDAFIKRRSIYALGKDIVVSDKMLENMIKNCLAHCPTTFNSQGGRCVLLSGHHHHKLWKIVWQHIKDKTPLDKQKSSKSKIESFANAYGTILFFEDMDTIEKLQKKYPLYSDAFPSFAAQSSGILQYMVWTVLAHYNIGASLQHYNPLIDEDVKTQWNLPRSWQLYCQMPFGSIEKPADEKDFMNMDERFLSFS